MIWTPHLLIQWLYLQLQKYKNQWLELVPNRYLKLFLTLLPKLDVFVSLRNDAPRMDDRDKHWSMIMHGDDNNYMRIEEDATSENFGTLKPL
jgi:hypothetical protein